MDTSLKIGNPIRLAPAKSDRRDGMTTIVKSRRYPRVGLPKGIVVAWEHSGIRRVSRVSVLALGGLFISTPNPPPAGEMIKIIFEIPGGDVRARAMVRDSRPNQGMGIEFTSMTQEARARLNQLLKILTRDIRPKASP
ncbi:MAG: PilZ domain-containing protein [Candidatus Acidiferrales bacterium]